MGSHRRLSALDETARRAALAGWAAEAADRTEPADVVAAAAYALAVSADLGVDEAAAPALIRDRSGPALGLAFPEGLLVDAWDLGIVHEATHDASSRRRRGVHYTPRSVALGLAAIALDRADATTTVCDPAVGGGAFLLATAEVLRRKDASPDEVLGRLCGFDIDPLAVAVAEASLALWGAAGGCWPACTPRLIVADTLGAAAPHLSASGSLGRGAPAPDACGDRFDVVIGNPPFQSQLAAGTAHDPATLAVLRRRWGVDAGPYCDTAGWFLLAALELAAVDGRIVLVLPQSLLASADAAAVREHLDARATVTGLWTGDRGVFEAEVRVCAPVVQVGAASGRPEAIRSWSGPEVAAGAPIPAPAVAGRWSELLARAAGVPSVDTRSAVPLASWCEATAGFRAQFYGLVPHTVELAPIDGGPHEGEQGGQIAEQVTVTDSGVLRPRQLSLLDGPTVCGDHAEAPDGPFPLVTVGMIEPLSCGWGSGAEYRYAGRRWTAPAVDLVGLEAADPTLARWVRARLVPKVLVATQTKVVEAVIDAEGRWIPSTPVIAVTADPGRLAHLAAALSSPVATAAALGASAGTALSGNTIKLSAGQVLALPTPVDHDAWDEGARIVEAIAEELVDRLDGLAQLGRVMIAAAGPGIGDPDVLFAWWWARVPQA